MIFNCFPQLEKLGNNFSTDQYTLTYVKNLNVDCLCIGVNNHVHRIYMIFLNLK